MRRYWIVIYLSVGATFGFILARPLWLTALAGQGWPANWAQAKPLLFTLALATGHGALRIYTWLPSMVYYLWTRQLTIRPMADRRRLVEARA